MLSILYIMLSYVMYIVFDYIVLCIIYYVVLYILIYVLWMTLLWGPASSTATSHRLCRSLQGPWPLLRGAPQRIHGLRDRSS